MNLEQDKFRRVAGLKFVPQILHSGTLEINSSSIYYTILTMLPGDDLVNLYGKTPIEQQKQLGRDVTKFMDALHEITGPKYEIGLYIPIISPFSGSWRDSHQRYWEILEQQSGELNLTPESNQVFNNAFQFLRASAATLDYQSSPKLLHNDLHPKNILHHQEKFSGVIDWECSQFGEADFELCHLIHWCVYPPQPDIDFRPFLRALFQSAPKCTKVPYLAQCLTIYQIEHEIQQIIWHGKDVVALRVPRIAHWLVGGDNDLLREIL
jgi:aminoglycoside phosphotransferase (APT) family kinase protein